MEGLMHMLIELDHVSKHYTHPGSGKRTPVLRDINLSVEKGGTVALVGPSGSGKSTLLNIMGALDQPSSGKVKLNGEDLSLLSENELSRVRNRTIGFIFQLHHLLGQCTVLENVLVPTIPLRKRGNMSADSKRANTLLERVGLHSHTNHRPGQLSVGECQRVAVARALINQPDLLLADEPTGSLDRASAENLCELLLELNREEGITLIVVTHSMELAGRMNRYFSLSDGRLILREPIQ
jgi:ABC-type lipoprotein export system ATPase subunit